MTPGGLSRRPGTPPTLFCLISRSPDVCPRCGPRSGLAVTHRIRTRRENAATRLYSPSVAYLMNKAGHQAHFLLSKLAEARPSCNEKSATQPSGLKIVVDDEGRVLEAQGRVGKLDDPRFRSFRMTRGRNGPPDCFNGHRYRASIRACCRSRSKLLHPVAPLASVE